MARVPIDIYAEQDEATTRVMVHAEGDPPVCILQYSRKLAAQSSDLIAVQILGDGAPDIRIVGTTHDFTNTKA